MNKSFKRGLSAFRLSMVLNGISDHFPIQIKAKCSGSASYSIFSWNLLADVHLYNIFKDISGIHFFEETILKSSTDNIYCNQLSNRLTNFFSEIGHYLYTKCVENTIIVNNQLLDDFISTDHQVSRLSWSEDPELEKEKKQQVEASRKLIVEFIKDKKHPYARKFQLAIQQSVELIYHIQSPNGMLRWKSRFNLMKHNKSLIHQMKESDFICLQECTNPDDIYNLLITQGKYSKMLFYAVDKNTSDHCVLLYDDTKFKLVGEAVYYALDGTKPSIFARFENKITNHKIIIASIHHPGGNHYCLNQLSDQVKKLKTEDFSEADYMVIGDYNHTQDFFDQYSLQFHLYYPSQGTMSGSDFGNVNCAIDAVMTNLDEKSVNVSVIEDLPILPLARCPVKIIL